jgi:RNA polymerase sigma-70 factor (ECF subfamily)
MNETRQSLLLRAQTGEENAWKAATLRAFRRLALEGASGADMSLELGMSVAAVYVAKSRVLQRIREQAEGLI